jgi:hypothetical protein
MKTSQILVVMLLVTMFCLMFGAILWYDVCFLGDACDSGVRPTSTVEMLRNPTEQEGARQFHLQLTEISK